jgi:hypothetical protein
MFRFKFGKRTFSQFCTESNTFTSISDEVSVYGRYGDHKQMLFVFKYLVAETEVRCCTANVWHFGTAQNQALMSTDHAPLSKVSISAHAVSVGAHTRDLDGCRLCS